MSAMTDTEADGWLIEWDGGWETCDSPAEGEEFIRRKIREWGDGDREEFSISRNVPTDRTEEDPIR